MVLFAIATVLAAWASLLVSYRFWAGGSMVRFVFFLLKMLMPVLVWPLFCLAALWTLGWATVAWFRWQRRPQAGPLFLFMLAMAAISLSTCTLCGVYLIRVTGSYRAFARAFGPQWPSRISPAQQRLMLQHRWMPVRFHDPQPQVQRNLAFWTIPGPQRQLQADLWLPPAGVKPSGVACLYATTTASLPKGWRS